MPEICLVHMPFSQPGHPSMALSVLAAECRAENLDVEVLYGNMRFARETGLKEYHGFLQYNKMFMLIGECLFKPYVGYSDSYTAADFFDRIDKAVAGRKTVNQSWNEGMQKLYKALEPKVEGYLNRLADHILSHNPKIVGGDITYEQRNASLALLRIIKQRRPEVITLLGGNNCTGRRGLVLAESFDFVDGVFSGEADHVFPAVCRKLLKGQDIQEVQKEYPSLMLPGADFVNGVRPELETCAFVDFDDYFQELRACGFEKNIEPCLLIEGSRGCWWGEKHPCTFCGIHTSGEVICYRAKSAERLFAELEHLQNRHGISSFVFTDCILSPRHIEELAPRLINASTKYRCFAEVKSNLAGEQVKRLRQAGFVLLQPGIEALQDDLLKLMNKGNRAIKHIELLKRCKQYGITVVWNMLKEMPFDKVEYYAETLRLSRYLSHLPPPTHLSTVLYQGNSLYNKSPADYGLKLEPFFNYKFAGSLGEDFIEDIADVFDNAGFVPDPAKEAVFQELNEWIDSWIQEFVSGSHLSYALRGDTIDILDLRNCAKHFSYTLSGAERVVYELSDSAITVGALREKAGRYDSAAIDEAIAYLEEEGLLIRIGDEVLGLAVSGDRLANVQAPKLPVGVVTFQNL